MRSEVEIGQYRGFLLVVAAARAGAATWLRRRWPSVGDRSAGRRRERALFYALTGVFASVGRSSQVGGGA
jgi:hypothetical protein